MKVPEAVLNEHALEATLEQLRDELLARDWEEVNLIASEQCPDLRPCPKCVVEADLNSVLGDKEKRR